MSRPRCQRCNEELDCAEITTYGDPEPVYIATGECECPGPRCSLCNTRIDKATFTTSPGECPNDSCVLWARPVPIPVIA